MRKQLPILQDLSYRGDPYALELDSSDAPSQIKNAYLDVHQDTLDKSQKLFLVKRPGLGTQSVLTAPALPANQFPIAMCASPADNKVFVIYYGSGGTSFYFNSVSVAVPPGWTGSSAYDIIPLTHDTTLYGGYAMAMTTSSEGAVISSAGAVSEITDADYTSWTGAAGSRTNMVAMDGYIFQADATNSRIYNSDLNAPTSWTSTGYISASLYPGRIIRLVRIRKYLVAFKTNSIEFFENAGNPTPGSPLNAVPELARRFGCSSVKMFVEASDGILWMGHSQSGEIGIFKLHYDSFQIEKVSNDFVGKLLQEDGVAGNLNNTGPWGVLLGAIPLAFRDKELALFSIDTDGYPLTLVYDNKLKHWGFWNVDAGAVIVNFPTMAWVRINNGTSNPETYVAGFEDPTIYIVSETAYRDNTSLEINVKFVSDKYDFGTQRRKFLNSLEVLYDVGEHSGGSATLGMYYYDTDDVTSPVTERTLTPNKSGSVRCIWRKLGSFRSRKFVITHFGNAPFRMGALELDISAAEDDID